MTYEGERLFDLKIAGKGGHVTWSGKNGEDAARRYVDCYRGATVIAWREGARHGLHIGIKPISQGGVTR